MNILDGVYGNGVYAKSWKSARLALLSTQKYCAVINNYSAASDGMDEFMRELGALPINDYLQKVGDGRPRKTCVELDEKAYLKSINQSIKEDFG